MAFPFAPAAVSRLCRSVITILSIVCSRFLMTPADDTLRLAVRSDKCDFFVPLFLGISSLLYPQALAETALGLTFSGGAAICFALWGWQIARRQPPREVVGRFSSERSSR